MEDKVIQSTINICEEEKECFNLYRHCRKKVLKLIKYIKSYF